MARRARRAERGPAPPQVRTRWERLRALADRPGTREEGAAARRQQRKLERRWPGIADEERAREAPPARPRWAPPRTDPITPESVQTTHHDHLSAIAFWVNGLGEVEVRSSPLRARGTVEAVRVVGGTGEWAEAQALRVAWMRARGRDERERELAVGGRLEAGEAVVLLLRSSWARSSRVSVHVTFRTEAPDPIALLAG